jgi:hypothetical protein
MTTKTVAGQSLGRSVPKKNGSQKSQKAHQIRAIEFTNQSRNHYHECMAVLLKKLTSAMRAGSITARKQRPVCAHRGVSTKP